MRKEKKIMKGKRRRKEKEDNEEGKNKDGGLIISSFLS